jgi:hypothetical protein
MKIIGPEMILHYERTYDWNPGVARISGHNRSYAKTLKIAASCKLG